MTVDQVGKDGWFFLTCGCEVFVVRDWRLHTQSSNTVECPESQRLHAAYAEVALNKSVWHALPERRAIYEHYGVPQDVISAYERQARRWPVPALEKPELVDRIGDVSGWYNLRCGCRMWVQYPGCWIHMVDARKSCAEMSRLRHAYLSRVPHGSPPGPEALTFYLAMLHHVGALDAKIRKIEDLAGIGQQTRAYQRATAAIDGRRDAAAEDTEDATGRQH
ncbi:hypothetical protein [Streptomyces aurantiacus]|uniref:hypothetical protein n=1 Tax=Streptomyces aurantiacus TaxID=47760 RepID=UPI0006E3254E|nr:hypothetical protein [Streptomyces aurantiacus]